MPRADPEQVTGRAAMEKSKMQHIKTKRGKQSSAARAEGWRKFLGQQRAFRQARQPEERAAAQAELRTIAGGGSK